MDKLVPDTSVLVDGRFMDYLKENEEKYDIIIPEAVLLEMVHQANVGRGVGQTGLEELKKLRSFADEEGYEIRFAGRIPYWDEVEGAKGGAIDEIVRDTAFEEDGILVTGDQVQKDSALIKGGRVIYLQPLTALEMRIENFFEKNVMSVHIKSDLPVFVKRGRPGAFKLEKTIENISPEDVEDIAFDIIERARGMQDSFIEMDERGATVVQLREYRIAITRPPFSDRTEITAVRPIKKMTLEEYNPADKLLTRLKERAEGILVAGSPGAGKSTFVQALAEYYHSMGRVVKTMEKPRDLVLNEEITQYTALEGSMEKTGDILLLVRPDYTIFDEMRTTDDFKVFADLRLAGVGMVGVVHATRGIDAIQRFVGRVELGTIPQIVDTIIYIQNGEIGEVYELIYKVKVPTGMMQEDLARPVIEVRDFFNDDLSYELYSFGEQIVAIPIEEERKGVVQGYAEEGLQRKIEGILDIPVRVEMTGDRSAVVYAFPGDISYIIGKGGSRIKRLEEDLGMSIDVREEGDMEVRVTDIKPRKGQVVVYLPDGLAKRFVEIRVDYDKVLEGKASAMATLKVGKRKRAAKELMKALKQGKTVTAVVKG